MSHFYRQKSYSYNETDQQILDLRKEMSNFLTKEEADIIINKRKMIVDPDPYFVDRKLEQMEKEIFSLKQELYLIRTVLNNIQNKIHYDEPTI
jgi:hypothetical protein